MYHQFSDLLLYMVGGHSRALHNDAVAHMQVDHFGTTFDAPCLRIASALLSSHSELSHLQQHYKHGDTKLLSKQEFFALPDNEYMAASLTGWPIDRPADISDREDTLQNNHSRSSYDERAKMRTYFLKMVQTSKRQDIGAGGPFPFCWRMRYWR